MNLRQIEVFRAVMLTGSVSAAAELLHVSQPAVSKVLASAARQSGLALFARIRGRLVPTPEAQRLHEEVEAMWRGVEKLRDVERELAQPSGGTLRLVATASIASALLPRSIARVYERFPGLTCRAEVLVPNLLVDALLEGDADIGIALLPNEHPNVQAVKSYECGLSCVVPRGHALARRKVVRASDLQGHRLISSPPNTPYGQTLQRAYRGGNDLHPDVEVRSAVTACWFVQAGVGIAVVDAAATAAIDRAGLVVLPFDSAEKIPVAVLMNRLRPPSVIEKAFVRAFDTVWRETM
jgi:DNA-binding transcriptional LysR family regulator